MEHEAHELKNRLKARELEESKESKEVKKSKDSKKPQEPKEENKKLGPWVRSQNISTIIRPLTHGTGPHFHCIDRVILHWADVTCPWS